MLSKDFMQQVAGRRRRERLGNVHVLVADHDARIARLVKHVLENFGFKHIHVAKDGSEAISVLNAQPVDLVITEWPMEPVNGLDLVKYIRTSPESKRKDLAVIMLTGKAEQVDVEMARDSGVTEYLVKPFTAKTLSHRIIQVIDNPRSFIMTGGYTGPDRRRQEPLPDGVNSDRRRSEEELEPYAIRKGDGVVYKLETETIVIKQPDRHLKEAIGSDMTAEKILDPENVRQAQQAIMEMQDDYLDWVAIDINRLEHVYSKLIEEPDNWDLIRELQGISFAIKSQAGTFDYDLASQVGELLYKYTLLLETASEENLMVIRKHIDTLYVIFHQEIQGTGNAVGADILKGLHKLIDKYSTGGS